MYLFEHTKHTKNHSEGKKTHFESRSRRFELHQHMQNHLARASLLMHEGQLTHHREQMKSPNQTNMFTR